MIMHKVGLPCFPQGSDSCGSLGIGQILLFREVVPISLHPMVLELL